MNHQPAASQPTPPTKPTGPASMQPKPKQSKNLLFLIIIMVACLGAIASDIYTPSLSAISGHFQVSIHVVQYSMAIFMFSFAALQLVYGPLSEAFGRRLPLLCGLVLMTIGSTTCALSHSISMLFIGRFLQGCGAAAGPLFRPIFRDVFKNEELAKYGSYAGIIMTFIVPAAPTLGGYLQHYFNWRASFIFLSCYAILGILLVNFFMAETNPHIQDTHGKSRKSLSFVLQAFKELLCHRQFTGYCLVTFISYGAFFAWFVTGPALLIHELHLSPVIYGWIAFAGGGIAMASAGFVNARLVARMGIAFMLQAGWSLMTVSGVLMLGGHWLFGMNVLAIVIPVVIFYFAVTLLWANIFAAAFSPFGHIAGYAGSVYGFMQILGGSVLASLMAHLPDYNQIPLAWVMIVLPLLALGVYRLMCVSPD